MTSTIKTGISDKSHRFTSFRIKKVAFAFQVYWGYGYRNKKT